MLPKLQQSSLAQSLRRDNPANHLQCIYTFIQVRINSGESSENKPINPINPGKITTLPKIHTHASEISPKNTSLKKNSKMFIMNQLIN